jgi:uracil-DNA glycosylase family protein
MARTNNAKWATLRNAAAHCRDCDLWRKATQTVFGEGQPSARLMLVGEQPGDREDRSGKPFVGPAGALLDRALVAAGIDRRDVYVTNVVKHFNWEPRGKFRIHKKPNSEEIAACRKWFLAEVELIKPAGIVCLGATAAQAIIAKDFKVTQRGGEILRTVPLAPFVVATIHPSSILRAPADARAAGLGRLIASLSAIREALGKERRPERPSVAHRSRKPDTPTVAMP